jgi:hypothetical protein
MSFNSNSIEVNLDDAALWFDETTNPYFNRALELLKTKAKFIEDIHPASILPPDVWNQALMCRPHLFKAAYKMYINDSDPQKMWAGYGVEMQHFNQKTFQTEKGTMKGIFGAKGTVYEPVSLVGGIGRGITVPDPKLYLDAEGKHDIKRYVSRNTYSNKRGISASYKRRTIMVAEADKEKPHQPDEVMSDFEYLMDKQARQCTAQLLQDMLSNGALPKNCIQLEEQVSISSCGKFNSVDYLTKRFGNIKLEVQLPEVFPAPDPLVHQVCPDKAGPPSKYNPKLIIMPEEYQKKHNELLLEDAQAKKVQIDAKAKADAAAGKVIPVKKKKDEEKFYTRFSRVVGWEGEPFVSEPKIEPIEDLTPWIDVDPKTTDVRAIIHWEFYRIATTKFPAWRPIYRATHIKLFDPVTKVYTNDDDNEEEAPFDGLKQQMLGIAGPNATEADLSKLVEYTPCVSGAASSSRQLAIGPGTFNSTFERMIEEGREAKRKRDAAAEEAIADYIASTSADASEIRALAAAASTTEQDAPPTKRTMMIEDITDHIHVVAAPPVIASATNPPVSTIATVASPPTVAIETATTITTPSVTAAVSSPILPVSLGPVIPENWHEEF